MCVFTQFATTYTCRLSGERRARAACGGVACGACGACGAGGAGGPRSCGKRRRISRSAGSAARHDPATVTDHPPGTPFNRLVG